MKHLAIRLACAPSDAGWRPAELLHPVLEASGYGTTYAALERAPKRWTRFGLRIGRPATAPESGP